jgi:hypothetical protein
VAQAAHTPIYFAADKGHEAAIKALVAAKADVHAVTKVRAGGGGRGGGGLGSVHCFSDLKV